MKFLAPFLVTMTLLIVACADDGPESTIAPVHWVLEEITEPSTLSIVGYIGSSSCSAFERVEVVEGETQVDISVLVRTRNADACTSDLRLRPIEVVLAAPLGERELVGCLPERVPVGVTDEGCRTILNPR